MDVKSSQVFFYAQARSNYNDSGTIIPFEEVKYNVGGGLNANGTFTAPVAGTYFFSFNGANNLNSGRANVGLVLNGVGQGVYAFAAENTDSYETMTLDSTTSLIEGDRVELVLYFGTLYVYPYNSFNGFLLEEDLSL